MKKKSKTRGPKPLRTCVLCNEKFKRNVLEDHFKKHDLTIPHNCILCHEIFSTKATTIRHLLEHAEEECNEFRCRICCIVLKSRKSLWNHENRHKAKIPCDKCGKQFKTRKEMQIHLATNHGEGPYACKVCKTACMTKYSLEAHMKTHDQDNVTQFICEVCGKNFDKVCTLKNHRRQVHERTDKGNYQCQVCGIQLATNRYLRQHLLNHKGIKRFECTMCSKKFATSSALTCHFRMHTGEKPYECQICSKSFAQKSILKYHLAVHAGLKAYQCSFCEHSFTTSSHRKVHVQRHHGFNISTKMH